MGYRVAAAPHAEQFPSWEIIERHKVFPLNKCATHWTLFCGAQFAAKLFVYGSTVGISVTDRTDWVFLVSLQRIFEFSAARQIVAQISAMNP
jgi:hypothetical protein